MNTLSIAYEPLLHIHTYTRVYTRVQEGVLVCGANMGAQVTMCCSVLQWLYTVDLSEFIAQMASDVAVCDIPNICDITNIAVCDITDMGPQDLAKAQRTLIKGVDGINKASEKFDAIDAQAQAVKDRVWIYVCIYTYIYIYMHENVNKCLCVRKYMCMCMYTYVCIDICG